MLHPFVSSPGPHAHHELGGLSASLVVHVALIGATVAITALAREIVATAGTPMRVAERVVFTLSSRSAVPNSPAPIRRARPAAHLVTPPRDAAATLPPIAELEIANVVVDLPDVSLPGDELANRASHVELPSGGLADMFAVALGRAPHPSPNAHGVYTADVVEKIAAPRPGNPAPRYPDFLLSAGIEGEVNVRFVVDTTGRVDESSLEFPTHAHRLFVSSVRRALLRSRFLPAEIAGQRVAQLVSQRYSFVMAH